MHLRLQVEILILDLIVFLLKRVMLILVCIRLHLHLVGVALLESVLRGSCVLVFDLHRLLQLLYPSLQLELINVPLVLLHLVVGFQLFKRLLCRAA